VYCQAGCQTAGVMAALDLGMVDLYDDQRGADYCYDDGRKVHRTPDKQFPQSGNKNGRPTLYRLSEVVAAVRDGRPVYLVEGEKDADAVRLLGATATTAPMGSANFRKVDAGPLTGAHVVVVPDRDPAGESWLADVVAELTGKAGSLRLAHVAAGKDAADHIAAGHGLDDLVDSPLPKVPPTTGRRLVLTCADTIDPQPVYWVWHQRMPTGCLALLAGREQVGKSTYAYHLAARITRGQLPGEHYGSPRSVLICATEDSWAHTIVPRLIAAGADRARVFRVEVMSADDIHLGLTLPLDVPAIEGAARQTGAALLLLDPLMSRLAPELDPHKDAEVGTTGTDADSWPARRLRTPACAPERGWRHERRARASRALRV